MFKETALIKSFDFNILIRCWLFSKLSFENLICIFKKTLREAFKEFILKTSEKFNVMNIHKLYIRYINLFIFDLNNEFEYIYINLKLNLEINTQFKIKWSLHK